MRLLLVLLLLGPCGVTPALACESEFRRTRQAVNEIAVPENNPTAANARAAIDYFAANHPNDYWTWSTSVTILSGDFNFNQVRNNFQLVVSELNPGESTNIAFDWQPFTIRHTEHPVPFGYGPYYGTFPPECVARSPRADHDAAIARFSGGLNMGASDSALANAAWVRSLMGEPDEVCSATECPRLYGDAFCDVDQFHARAAVFDMANPACRTWAIGNQLEAMRALCAPNCGELKSINITTKEAAHRYTANPATDPGIDSGVQICGSEEPGIHVMRGPAWCNDDDATWDTDNSCTSNDGSSWGSVTLTDIPYGLNHMEASFNAFLGELFRALDATADLNHIGVVLTPGGGSLNPTDPGASAQFAHCNVNESTHFLGADDS